MNNENENKELEFDPTESEAFYKNLQAALEVDEPKPEELPVIEVPVVDAPTEAEEVSAWDDEELPELVFAEDLFQTDETEISGENVSEDGMQKEESPEDSQDQMDADEKLFLGVDAALTEQIENEFGSVATTKESVGGKIKSFFQLVPTWTKVLVSVILFILLSVGFLFGTDPGRTLFSKVVAKVIFMFIETVPDETPTPSPMETPENTPGITETVTPAPTGTVGPTPGPTEFVGPTVEPTVGPTVTPTSSPTPTPVPIMDSEDVINILLLGVENIYGSKFGRTDAILVASINKKTGEIKLVSFLRDTWVQIPGEADDRLNAAYAHGGATLMMETIELNFQIDIDSYVVINFSGFENLIDELGGLRISLTPAESDYLNTTKYISNADERNTVAGYQMMTGSQVLGYCRVRSVPTANGLKYDFGRTYRQRVVLKALFDKYKEKSFVELLTVMRKCFGYVTAPESLESLAAECLRIVMEKKTLDFDTKQIPASGHFSETTIQGKDVIKPYIDNTQILQEFLYGKDAN